MVVGNFWCANCTCGKEGRERDFSADIESPDSEEEIFCSNNKELKLKLMGTSSFSIQTHERSRGKGRSAGEISSRRKESFHDQVSTKMHLDKTERAHFGKKFGKPKQR